MTLFRGTTLLSATIALLCCFLTIEFAATAGASKPSNEATTEVPARPAPFKLAGFKWPGLVIPIIDKSELSSPRIVSKAIDQWNDSGMGVRFKKVKRTDQPRVLIRTDWRLTGGYASLGYQKRGGFMAYPRDRSRCDVPERGSRKRFVRLVEKQCPTASIIDFNRPGGRVWLEPQYSGKDRRYDADLVYLVVHELGHILGLAHRDTECLVMNTIPRPGCAYKRGTRNKVMCSVPMPGDIEGAVQRYGGEVLVPEPESLLCDRNSPSR